MSKYIRVYDAVSIPVLPKHFRRYQTDNLDDAYELGWNDMQTCLNAVPAAAVQPVVPGQWKLFQDEYSEFIACSVCGKEIVLSEDCESYTPYCPYCGAKMTNWRE